MTNSLSSIRYCRLTYNKNGYENPSGKEGKSMSKKTHEGIEGFGWEEWLFNDVYHRDGYHYGFIQAFKSLQTGSYKDIWLYNYNNVSHEFKVVAHIDEIERIQPLQSVNKITHNNLQEYCNVRFRSNALKMYNKAATNQRFHLRYSNLYKPDAALENYLKQL